LPEAADEAALAQVARDLGADEPLQRLAPLSHAFTHFKLDIEPRLGEARNAPRELMNTETVWAPLAKIDAYGVPAPVRKLIDALSGPLI
jgi:A/G-specific adenine glycosylase